MCDPAQPGSKGYFPKMCADEVNDEDEGQVCQSWILSGNKYFSFRNAFQQEMAQMTTQN